MARRRMIDPSFWEDPTIGTLSLEARLLFLGMVSHADDDGRLEVEPRYIRRAVFGFDEAITTAHVCDLLSEIRDTCRNVVFYEVDGRALACFTNWRRYQYIQKKQDSKLPPPQDDTDNNRLSAKDDTVTVPVAPNRREENRKEKNRSESANAPARAHKVSPVPKPEKDKTLKHPAVTIYRDVFHLTPSPQQRQLIIEQVTDAEAWRQACLWWQGNKYRPESVQKIIDRYQNGDPFTGHRNGSPTSRSNGARAPAQPDGLKLIDGKLYLEDGTPYTDFQHSRIVQ